MHMRPDRLLKPQSDPKVNPYDSSREVPTATQILVASASLDP